VQGELVIYGAGGAGRELAFSLAQETNSKNVWKIKGFVDDDPKLEGKKINDIPVLGNINWLEENGGNVAVCVVGNPNAKRELVKKLTKIQKIKFPRIIAPNCIISSYIEWGEGCIVALSFNYITVNIKIGDFVFINCSTRIGHDVVIGSYTTIFSDVDVSGGTVIGSDCIIGSGVTINPDIKIGNGSIIGAGSVVVKDIPEYVVAAGVPTKIIKELR